MYNDLTSELVEARRVAVELTNAYNASYGQPPEVREPLLHKILGEMGEDVFFEPSFRCEFGYNIKIGNHFYANFDCVMLDPGGIEIGDNVLFSPRVSIYTAKHAFDVKERSAGACFAKNVTIGNNVWVVVGAHMNCGITIGGNTAIGAGSVIIRDIPANVVAAGVPCRVIRKITVADKSDYFRVLETLLKDCVNGMNNSFRAIALELYEMQKPN